MNEWMNANRGRKKCQMLKVTSGKARPPPFFFFSFYGHGYQLLDKLFHFLSFWWGGHLIGLFKSVPGVSAKTHTEEMGLGRLGWVPYVLPKGSFSSFIQILNSTLSNGLWSWLRISEILAISADRTSSPSASISGCYYWESFPVFLNWNTLNKRNMIFWIIMMSFSAAPENAYPHLGGNLMAG